MPAQSAKRALILGATGLTGSFLLELLLEDERYEQVTVLVRRPLSLSHHKLEQVQVDFEKLDECADSFAIDEVFCCLGTTIKKAGSRERFRRVDYGYPLVAARLAHEKGANTFCVISSLGVNPGTRNFYLSTKRDLEEALADIGFARLIILRPSLLLGDRNEVRFGESIGMTLMKALGFVLAGPLRKYRAIKASTVAWCMRHLANTAGEGVTIVESDELQKLFSNFIGGNKMLCL